MVFGGADDGQGQVEAAAFVGIGRVEMEQHVSTRSDQGADVLTVFAAEFFLA